MKKTASLSVIWLIICFFIFLLAGPAHSSTLTTDLTFGLNVEFSGATEPAGVTTPWLTASFKDTGSNTVTLTMSAKNLVNSEFVFQWYFNLDPNLDPADLSFLHIDGFSAVEILKSDNHSMVKPFKADGDGYFDILFDFPSSGNDRFKTPLTSVYEITSTSSINAFSFNFGSIGGDKGSYYTAAHVGGIGDDGELSGWIGTAVPIPPTFLLFGSFLVGMAGLRIKSRKP